MIPTEANQPSEYLLLFSSLYLQSKVYIFVAHHTPPNLAFGTCDAYIIFLDDHAHLRNIEFM
jgi:hypothetical protein